jgi:hypothetical protein
VQLVQAMKDLEQAYLTRVRQAVESRLTMQPLQATGTGQTAGPRAVCNQTRRLMRLPPLSHWILLFGCNIVLSVFKQASFAATSQERPAASLLAVPARTWAVDCANNEVLVIQHSNSHLRYRLHIVDGKGDQVRDQIETPEGTVSRLIRRDGRALTPQEDSDERSRLNALASSPATFARHIRHDEEGRKTGIGLMRMMPDAMLWTYAPGQPQLPDRPAGTPPLVVIDFAPNSKWSPPTLESELLTGIEGRVWIDPQTRNMEHLQASVVRPVNIGWGMLAHIYPGGTVTLQQSNAGGQRWIMDHLVEQLTLQALVVKTVKQRLVFDVTDFQTISPMRYRQAITILLETPLPAR